MKENFELRIANCEFGEQEASMRVPRSANSQFAIRNSIFLMAASWLENSQFAIRNSKSSFIPFAPDQASTVSGTVDDLYAFLVGLTFFFSVLITGLIIYFTVASVILYGALL